MVVAGIDVGGTRKGFHGVALQKGIFLEAFSSRDARKMAGWCRGISARQIGIDAPCRWSLNGRARSAERELGAAGVSCFATPSREAAQNHPGNYYGWMLNGAELFRLLEKTHPLFDGTARSARGRVCFETFPQAIACVLAGKTVSAKEKQTVRRTLLSRAGIDPQPLLNIDLVDAALCALAAHCLARGTFHAYGEATSGLIVVPSVVLPRPAG